MAQPPFKRNDVVKLNKDARSLGPWYLEKFPSIEGLVVANVKTDEADKDWCGVTLTHPLYPNWRGTFTDAAWLELA